MTQLHGVAAAEHGRLAACPAGKPRPLVPLARRAVDLVTEIGHVDLPNAVFPEFHDDERPRDRAAIAAEDFDGLDRFDRRDQTHRRREDAGRFAGGRAARRRTLGHQAAETGGLARQDGHRLPLRAQATAVNPRNVVAQRGVVDEEAGFEIVGTVDDHVHAVTKAFDVKLLNTQHLDDPLEWNKKSLTLLGHRPYGGCEKEPEQCARRQTVT